MERALRVVRKTVGQRVGHDEAFKSISIGRQT